MMRYRGPVDRINGINASRRRRPVDVVFAAACCSLRSLRSVSSSKPANVNFALPAELATQS